MILVHTKALIRRWDKYVRVVDIGLVEVTQSTSLDTTKPEKPKINWKAIGAVKLKEAQRFSSDLYSAMVLAEILESKDIPWEPPPARSKKLTVRRETSLTDRSMILWMPRWDNPEDQK